MNAVSLVERGEMRFICAENEAAKKWKGENGEVWSLIWHSLRFLSLRPSLIQSTLVWYLTSPPAVGNDTSRRRPESGLPKEPKGKKGGAGSSPPAWQLPHQQAGMKLDPDTKSLYEPWDSGHLQWAECRLSLRRASSGWERDFSSNVEEGLWTLSGILDPAEKQDQTQARDATHLPREQQFG